MLRDGSCRSRVRRRRACRRCVFKATAGVGHAGSPRLAVGAAGNAWIPASVYDIILNVVDGGMDGAARDRSAAVPDRPRSGRPGPAAASRSRIAFPTVHAQDLTRARGHRFQKIGRKGEVRYGYAAATRRRRRSGAKCRAARSQPVPCRRGGGAGVDDAVEPLSPTFVQLQPRVRRGRAVRTAYPCAPAAERQCLRAILGARIRCQATTGMLAQRGSARIRPTKSNPVACGMAMSVTTRSGGAPVDRGDCLADRRELAPRPLLPQHGRDQAPARPGHRRRPGCRGGPARSRRTSGACLRDADSAFFARPGADERQPHGELRTACLPPLSAVTVPPCSSTRCRTSERPRPSPACSRVTSDFSCRNRSNTCGRNAGSMPAPVSVTVSTASSASRSQRDADLVASLRELDRVREQVPDDLLQPARRRRRRTATPADGVDT